MATLEEQYAAMASGDPSTYAAVAFPGSQNDELSSTYQEIVPMRKDASPLITNVPELRPSASVYIEPPPVARPPTQEASTPQGTGDIFADYESRAIGAKDFLSKQRVINEFADNIQQRLGQAQQGVSRIVERDLNIQPERQRLQALMIMDSNNRELYGRDSPDTTKQRAKVLALEEAAIKKTQDMLKNSPEYNNFTSRAKNSVSLMSKMAEKAFNDAERLAQKEETRKDNAQMVVAAVDPAARDAISTYNPAMKDDVIFAEWVMKGGGKSKDWVPILTGQLPPSEYLQATMEGNGAARQLAVSEYSRRTGKPPEEAARTIMQAETLAKSPDMFAQTAARLGIMTPVAAKDFVAKYNIASSSDRKEMNKIIMSKIPDIMEASTINYVKTDPTAVAATLNDPAFVEAGAKVAAKNPNKKPTTLDIANVYTNDPTLSNQQKIDRQDALVKAYAAALAKEGSNGILHMPFEKSRIEDESRKFKTSVTVKTVSDTLAKKIGEMMGRGIEGANQLLPSTQLYNFHESMVKGAYNVGDDVFSGISQGMGGNQ